MAELVASSNNGESFSSFVWRRLGVVLLRLRLRLLFLCFSMSTGGCAADTAAVGRFVKLIRG